METLTTHGIKISVQPFYLPNESFPAQQKYVHAYHIVIENMGDETVQLLRRHWYIVESNGMQREVQGDGVIGQQPVIAPRERHEYTSWCPLMTDIGKMFGYYVMARIIDQQEFKVLVPEFRLIPPFKLN